MLIQKVYCVIYQFLIQTFRVEDDVGDECRGSYIRIRLEHPFLLLFFFQD